MPDPQSVPPPSPPDVTGARLRPSSNRKALEWVLVLDALSVPHRLEPDAAPGGGWWLLVPPEHIELARRQIDLYERENIGWPPPEIPPPRPVQRSGWSAVWVAGLLLALYFWLGPYRADVDILARAACDASKIAQGEWWRILTAMGVHGDVMHLLSNVAVILPLGAVAAMTMGGGLAWSMTLLAGALANLTSVLLIANPGVSLGASTAGFALLGLLGGWRLTIHPAERKTRRSRAKRILGAILAMLAMLGAAPHSDLAGHFFALAHGVALGALCGVILGVVRVPEWVQRLLEIGALALFMLAWRHAAG